MKTTTRSSRGVVAGTLALVLAGARASGQVNDAAVPGRAVVRVPAGAPIGAAIADLQARLPGVTFTVADAALADRGLYLLNFDPPTPVDPVELVLESLAGDPDNLTSEWGEVLYLGHDPEGHTGSVWFFTTGGAPSVANQYAGATLALAVAQQRATGAGVVVAVLDTGIDAAHPLLVDSVTPGGFNFIDDSDVTLDVGDGLDNDGDQVIDESVGHGTFVAGLIHFVAPGAQLLPVVVLDSDGRGDSWLFAKGLFYAIDQGVEVINLSLGTTYNSDAVGDALDEAKHLGIVVVAAGGNQNAGEEFEEFPAARSNGLGVAAVDDQDVKADFSNYNSRFFISAPGANGIIGALPLALDDYGDWSGTSFATAFASGTAALIRAQHPDWPLPSMVPEDIVEEIKKVIADSAVDIYNPLNKPPQNQEFVGQLGVGRLDAGAAVLAAVQIGAGDIDADGVIGIVDFLALLEAWGPCVGVCRADLDGDGIVGLTDFLTLLANWG